MNFDSIDGRAVAGNRVHAGTWKQAMTAPSWGRIEEVCWVKSHQTNLDQLEEQERTHDEGNDAADASAKDAIQLHPIIFTMSQIRDQIHIGKKAVEYAGRALALWPTMRDSFRNLSRRAAGTPMTDKPPKLKHNWAPVAGQCRATGGEEDLYRCLACLGYTKGSPYRQSRYVHRACVGLNKDVISVSQDQREHDIKVFSTTDLFLLACMRCGKFGTQKLKGLLQRCPGYKTEAGKRDLSRILAGKHPCVKRRTVGHGLPLEAITYLRGE